MGIPVEVIKGNGIGPEITEATIHVLEAAGIEFDWVPVMIGDEGVEHYHHPLPQESVRLLCRCCRCSIIFSTGRYQHITI